MKKIIHLIGLFVTTISLAQTPIQVFNFENTMSNTTNTATFTALGVNPAANTSFANDRSGRASSALVCSGGNTYYSTIINNLPLGNTPRTISFWFRSDNNFQDQHVFSYGQNGGNQAQGYSVYGGSGFTSSYYGFGNDLNNGIGSTAYLQGNWYLYVLTFDGTTASVYRNGNLLGSANKSTWTTNSTSNQFFLGSINGSVFGLQGAIDDFKIYNVALNQSQVSAINDHRFANIQASATLARETAATTSGITLNYRVDAGNLPTSVVLKYGTTAGNLTNSVTISSGLVNSALTEMNYTLTGLNANTSYYYTLTAENESGKTVLAERSFATSGAFPSNGLIAYFPFENNTSSTDNTHSFTAVGAAPTYAVGQVGQAVDFANDLRINASTALINNGSLNTAISGSEITVSMWIDNAYTNTGNTSQYPSFIEFFNSLFMRQEFGATGMQRGFASSSSTFVNNGPQEGPNISAGFHHVALVHKSGANGTNGALYVDGVFVSNLGNTNPVDDIHRFNTKVYLGGGASDVAGNESINKRYRGKIDELYIHNRALTAGEILAVMNNTNQSLATKDFNSSNLKFNLYPNPASNLLNIQLETELKSIEIYSLLGQKVLTTSEKQINISGLSNGVYMVRVADTNGAVATQKLIKE